MSDGACIEASEGPESPLPTGSKSEAEPRSLDELEAAVASAWGNTLRYSRLGGESLMATAAALVEAGALCSAEEWPALLKRAAVPWIAVQRLLEIYRVALDVPALERLGGVPLAAIWASEARLPRQGEALAVTVGEWRPDRSVPVAYVWPAQEPASGFLVASLDLANPSTADRATRAPLAREPEVWGTVWHLLGPHHADLVFRPIRQDVAGLVAKLEDRRRALLETDTRVVH